jgi:methylphosphotriester-DNA--protein-cysteine methyltransferase
MRHWGRPVLNGSDHYREWAPGPAWRTVVACCWEQEVGADRVQRVVPDGRADLLFSGDGAITIVGVADVVAVPALVAGTRIFGVRLRAEAVGAAFRHPAVALLNHTVAAEDVLGARRARRLADPAGLDAWLRSIELDRRAAHAVELLEYRTVGATAAELGITPRQLHRIVRAEVGVAPSTYRRIRRFQRFVRRSDARVSLAIAAAEAGYADQAHLTRDVVRLAGLTPSRLAAERRQ